MGTLLAQGRDIVSFAPGYPAPERSRGRSSRRSRATLLRRSDGSVLQYGADPRLPAAARGDRRASWRRAAHRRSLERLLVTTGSQQGLDLVARVLLDPGDVILVELPTYTGAITAFRNVQAPHGRRAAGERRHRRSTQLDATCEQLRRDGRRVRFLYVVPNFQNPTGLLIGLRQAAAAARVGRAARRADRRGRPVPRSLFRGLGDRSRRPADRGRRCERARDLFEQLLEDAGARVTASPGSTRRRRSPRSWRWPSRRRISAPAGSISASSTRRAGAGMLERQLPMLRAHYQHKRDVMVEALQRRHSAPALHWPRAARRVLPVGRRCRRASTPTR